MKKTHIFLVVLAIGIVAAGVAAAQGWGRSAEKEQIMEEGNYQELVQYREESGYQVMPWVESQEDFELAQQMHQKMDAWRAENPDAQGGCPMMGGKGGRSGGCKGGCRFAQ
jgi:hypothetical protein